MAIEAAGEIVTGSLIGRAVEPDHGEEAVCADGLTHETKCLNCRAPLVGSYCHACGQNAHLHRSLAAFGHDILHGVFHFEGKIWSTLPLLFWDPGALTRRYIQGERARFVSPLALFLFSVFLMFAVFESVGGPVTINNEPATKVADAETRKADLRNTIVTLNEMRVALEAERQSAIANGQSTDGIDAKLDALGDKLGEAAKQTALSGGFSLEELGSSAQIDTGSVEFDTRVREGLKNPKLLLYKLQSSAYKFAWAIIPLSLPFMWLIFASRQQYKLYDHAIFVTYSITFVMLLLFVMALSKWAGLDLSVVILFLPTHFFFQLRSAYGLSIFSALWRTVALVVSATIVMIVFACLQLALGLSG